MLMVTKKKTHKREVGSNRSSSFNVEAIISKFLPSKYSRAYLPIEVRGKCNGNLEPSVPESPGGGTLNSNPAFSRRSLAHRNDGSLARRLAFCGKKIIEGSIFKKSGLLHSINDKSAEGRWSNMRTWNRDEECLTMGEFCARHSDKDIVMNKVKVIGEYLIGDIIGYGSFCKVKEGLSVKTLSRVAVKVIKIPYLRRGSESISVIMREIKIHSGLDHINIVKFIKTYARTEEKDDLSCVKGCESGPEASKIVDFSSGSDVLKCGPLKISKVYMVFEFCLCTLEELILCSVGKKIPEHLCKLYFVQIMHGVKYLHSKYIIHFDIKPSNILLTKDGLIKISDMGLSHKSARYVQSAINKHIPAGTKLFMAPETIDSSERMLGEKVDIWACGVTLYNMLTGLYPFSPQPPKAHQRDSIFESILFSPPTFLQSTPDECKDLLINMLQKDPVNRYNVDDVISHRWCITGRDLYIPPDMQHLLDSAANDSPCEVCNPNYAQWLSRIHANSVLRYVKKHSLSEEPNSHRKLSQRPADV